MIAGDVLHERARLPPDKIALVYVPTGERLRYGDLDGRAAYCAHLWRKIGLCKGDRVGILAQNCVEYVDAFFAAGRSGIILVPLNTRLTVHELQSIAADSGMRALMYSSRYAETACALKKSVNRKHWIALDVQHDHGDVPYACDSSVSFDPVRCDPEDIYCLLYTSGTTGKPKGVMIPHRMVAWNGYNTVCFWQLHEDDVSPVFTPMYHAGGLAVSLVPLFVIGGTVVLHDGFDAYEVWRTIERERCTFVFGVPTIFKMLMEAPEFATANLSRVRWLISGGAPLPQYIIGAYQQPGITLKQGYGLTEAGVNCFAMTAEESARKAGSIGRPMMFTQTRLVKDGAEVAHGEVGELWIRGPHVSRGYWNRPEATAAAFDSDSWLHTGDLARCDQDGFYYIAGRLKDMIISGGVNVYPAEIEAELLQHPAVQDAAVIGVPHETWGEVPIAFVVLRAKTNITPSALSGFLTSRLTKYKVPKEILAVDILPRTAYGKVVKAELRGSYLRAKAGAS